MWQQHIILLVILAALALPLYFIDQWLLKPGGGFLPVDLRGLVFNVYLMWFGVHMLVSTCGVFLLPSKTLLAIHGVGAVLAVLALLAGFQAYGALDKSARDNERELRMQARKHLYDHIALKEWWVTMQDGKPAVIHAQVAFRESGRFAAHVSGRTANDQSAYHGELPKQLQVKAGDTVTVDLGLTHYEPGPVPPENMEFTFYLFQDKAGQPTSGITKFYKAAPEVTDDGQYFYAPLPPPVQK